MSNYELINKQVIIYGEGGWSFEGKVEFMSSEILVLDDGSHNRVIYRNKIVAASILPEIKTEESLDLIKTSTYQVPVKTSAPPPSIMVEQDNHFEIGNAYGSIIPEDMLEGDSHVAPVDFAIQMSTFKNVGALSDSRKENKVSRKRNSK